MRKLHRTASWLSDPLDDNTEGLVLFSACDEKYVDHAVPLIRSADVFSPGSTFVLHVVNPSEASMTRLRRLQSNLSCTSLHISKEVVDLSALDDDGRRVYYACSRFIRLAEIIDGLSRDILCLDADSLVTNHIDLDFTDKSAADICLVRRDLNGPAEEHLAVAAGSIWLRPSGRTRAFVHDIARDIVSAFSEDHPEWFLDQVILKRQIVAHRDLLRVYNIKSKYADWQFRDDSIIWSGKGERKENHLYYVLLKRSLTDDLSERYRTLPLMSNLSLGRELFSDGVWQRIRTAATAGLRPRVIVYVPRADLPWKRPSEPDLPQPAVGDDVLDLRLHWKAFASRLAGVLERAGLKVDVLEVPAWEIEPKAVEKQAAALAFIPHRCYHDFEIGSTPVIFYMQEYFRWMFVADPKGWSAASSKYPFDAATKPVRMGGAYRDYRRRMRVGLLKSKFAQVTRRSAGHLRRSGDIPFWGKPYIFFPLQVPHDQSIQYFCDHAEMEVLVSLFGWAARRGVEVTVKPHPANMKSMEPFIRLAKETSNVRVSHANIEDLISNSSAVYTINSGVGFEAILHGKPIVTFGKVEYDCVSYRGDLRNLDAAWGYVNSVRKRDLLRRYRRFFDWFVDEYAIDLSRPAAADRRLGEIAADVARLVGRNVEARWVA